MNNRQLKAIRDRLLLEQNRLIEECNEKRRRNAGNMPETAALVVINVLFNALDDALEVE